MINPFDDVIKEIATELIQFLSKQPKRVRLIIQSIVVLATLALFAGFAFTLKDEAVSVLGVQTNWLIVFASVATVAGIISAILSYIEDGPADKERDRARRRNALLSYTAEDKLNRRLIELLKEASNDKNSNVDIDVIVKEKIGSFLETSLDEKLNEKYVPSAITLAQAKQIEGQIKELQSGVNVQIGKLSRSATINLLIGLSTTVVAIAVLLNLILDAKDKHFTNFNEMIPYLLPRTVLAIFIETFSFFFLRLYKDNLEDVKYFHNERTNIDSKVIALKTAIAYGDKEIIAEAIKSFLAVERNFILKKDETTINIERIRMSSQQEVDLLTKLADIIEKGRKNS
jgi:hypothetical protein